MIKNRKIVPVEWYFKWWSSTKLVCPGTKVILFLEGVIEINGS
jgi:hypothetical protein